MIAYESVGKLDMTSHIGWTHLCLQFAMDWEATSLTFAGSYHMFESGLALHWSRMGSAGMTKPFFIGFSHPSGRQARAYSHSRWAWLRLRASELAYCHSCTIFLGKLSHNTNSDLSSRQHHYCWMGEAAKSHCKVYGHRER